MNTADRYNSCSQLLPLAGIGCTAKAQLTSVLVESRTFGRYIVAAAAWGLLRTVWSARQGAAGGIALAKRGVVRLNQARSYLKWFDLLYLGSRFAPWYISTPLGYVRDEIKSLGRCLRHPVDTLTSVIMFCARNPARTAKLVQACGIPVDPATMMVLKFERDLDMLQNDFSVLMKNGACPVYSATISMKLLRGRMLVTLLQCLFQPESLPYRRLIAQMRELLTYAEQRVMAKCFVKCADHTEKMLVDALEKNDSKAAKQPEPVRHCYTRKRRRRMRHLWQNRAASAA